jgi:putative Mn2+ efflux pump MntP
MQSFTSVIALGLDSFLACAVIGTRSFQARERVRFAFAFGAGDAMATLLGSFWPHQALELPTIVLWALCAFLLLRMVPSNRSLLYAMPALLSFDNLFAGSPAGRAPVLGLSSAAMALIGLWLGTICRRVFVALATEA